MYLIMAIDNLDSTFRMVYANQGVVLVMNDSLLGGLL